MSAAATGAAGRARRNALPSRSLVLVPPEGVPLHLVIPTLGARTAAQVIDLLITILATVALILALVYVDLVSGTATTALISLVGLLAGTPLYILFELLMNGRTPGKRLLGLRVVSLDGTGLTTHQIVLRNLLKEVEILIPLQVLLSASAFSLAGAAVLAWTVAVVAVVLRSRARQRIGDFAANTVVVEQPVAELLPDLAVATVDATVVGEPERFVFTTAQLDLYGAYELQVLEKLLRARTPEPGEPPAEALREVAASIRRKIRYPDEVPDEAVAPFLLAFYRAQRAFLEGRRLFGDARDDKFHREVPLRPTDDATPSRAYSTSKPASNPKETP